MSSFMRVLERNAEIRTIDQKCKRTNVYFCDEHLVQASSRKAGCSEFLVLQRKSHLTISA